jgi:predicted RNase H-like nuclease (RuvC/YqgF family)
MSRIFRQKDWRTRLRFVAGIPACRQAGADGLKPYDLCRTLCSINHLLIKGGIPMLQTGKIARLILILLVIVSLLLASAATYLLQQEMKKSSDLNKRLTETLNSEKTIQSSLDNSRQELSRLNALVSGSDDKIKSLHADIATLEDEKKTLAENLAGLKVRFDNIQKENTANLKMVDTLKSQMQEKQKQLESAAKEKEELSAKLASLELKDKEPVRLEKIVVRPADKGTLTGMEAKVSSVNKKFRFVIIDRGQKDGVRVGDIFTCFAKDKDIGQIEVEKVYDSLSSARFLPNLQEKNIKEGLRVTRN